MGFFPLFFEMKERRVLVVGAGEVGGRRIRVMESFGAAITAVEPEPLLEIRQMEREGRIRLICASYREAREELWRESKQPFFLVFAATGDPEMDQMVLEDGARSGAFVNTAGDKTKSDFYFPAIIREEEMTAGLISGGSSPGKTRETARIIRQALESAGQNGKETNRDG